MNARNQRTTPLKCYFSFFFLSSLRVSEYMGMIQFRMMQIEWPNLQTSPDTSCDFLSLTLSTALLYKLTFLFDVKEYSHFPKLPSNSHDPNYQATPKTSHPLPQLIFISIQLTLLLFTISQKRCKQLRRCSPSLLLC